MSASGKYNGRTERVETIRNEEEDIAPRLERILSLDESDTERRVYDAYAGLMHSRKSMTRMIARANLITTNDDSYDNRVVTMIASLVQQMTMRPSAYRNEVQQFLAMTLAYIEDARDDLSDAEVSSPSIDHTLSILHIIEKVALLSYEKPEEVKSVVPDDYNY